MGRGHCGHSRCLDESPRHIIGTMKDPDSSSSLAYLIARLLKTTGQLLTDDPDAEINERLAALMDAERCDRGGVS